MAADPRQEQREQALTDTVLESFAHTPDERLREVITALTAHLHAFVREVRLTEDEWARAIQFLTSTGHITDSRRQEFILLSDVLGVSMQTITVNDTIIGATEQTVVGPFFVADAPAVPLGGDIAAGAPGEPCWVEGTVTGPDGTPIAHAVLDVWEADDEGRYDVQYPDARVAARARLVADDEGRYRFWALTPTPYPIPDDGPVGALLAATARSPMRSPHLHFRVEAPGRRTVTTHIFVRGDGLEHDSVFGVRPSLIKDFRRHAAGEPTPDGRELGGTWTDVRFDVVLADRS